VPALDDVAEAIRPNDLHFPRSRLLCLENTHNRAGGTVMSVAETDALGALAHSRGLLVHLDGARLFNAAVHLGVRAAELTRAVDSVQVCLSKGLCCPAGSILAGSAGFVAEARRNRKVVGGGLRQAGFLAAPGIVALESMVDRLAEDHARAARLARELAALPGVTIDLDAVQTNIVRFETPDARAWVEALRGHGVLGGAMGRCTVRLVTHNDVADEGLDRALVALGAVAAQLVEA
jgi:threonine aldolase